MKAGAYPKRQHPFNFMVCDSPQHWVAARLSDGLGNRLFQLAAAAGASSLWGYPLVFAMPYTLPAAHGRYDSIFRLFPSLPRLWKAEADIAVNQDGESCFEYNPLPVIAPAATVLLRGSWIAAKYVPNSFLPSWDSVSDQVSLLAKWQIGPSTAFLHVRLGDYRILPHHQVNLFAFYAAAISKFPEGTKFLVFSDELNLARQLLMPLLGEVDFQFCEETDEVTSLFLMAQCQAGAITANSTFSWWGAFFGRQAFGADYVAYMPKRWMASGETTTDVFPEWAVKLDV